MEEKEVKRRVNKYERETKTLMQRIEKGEKKGGRKTRTTLLSPYEGEIDIFKMYSRKAIKKRKRRRIVSSGGLGWWRKRERAGTE